ncbi:MAG: hypothetical protein AAFY15_00005 [Cyanobacteria bacterium J06648_11]
MQAAGEDLPEDIRGLVHRLGVIERDIEGREAEVRELKEQRKSMRRTVELITGEPLPGGALRDEQVEVHVLAALAGSNGRGITMKEIRSAVKAKVQAAGGSANGLALSITRVLAGARFVQRDDRYALASAPNERGAS